MCGYWKEACERKRTRFKGNPQNLSYEDGSTKDGDKAGEEEADAAGIESPLRGGELKAEGGCDGAECVERIHEIAGGLKETSD